MKVVEITSISYIVNTVPLKYEEPLRFVLLRRDTSIDLKTNTSVKLKNNFPANERLKKFCFEIAFTTDPQCVDNYSVMRTIV